MVGNLWISCASPERLDDGAVYAWVRLLSLRENGAGSGSSPIIELDTIWEERHILPA